MKYDLSCKFISLSFSILFKSYLKKNFSYCNYKKIVKDVKKEYKEMILRTPGLSKDNNMASNLKGAAYFFSVAKKTPNMNVEKMDKMIDDIMTSKLMYKMNAKARKKAILFSEKYQDKMYKDSLRSQKSEDAMDWRYVYYKGNNECRYDIFKCGVCKLAEQENVLEYLPSMCKMDYPKYASKGAILIRDKTLANGDDCCNFHLIRK